MRSCEIRPRISTATFKLYRNLDALYDVMGNVAESAGAFGSKDEFQSLSNDLNAIREEPPLLGRPHGNPDRHQRSRTRTNFAPNEVPAGAAAAPPKKIVVDDNEPKKPAPKKKDPKPPKPAIARPPPRSRPRRQQ